MPCEGFLGGLERVNVSLGQRITTIMKITSKVLPSHVRLCFILTVQKTLGFCFQLNVVIQELIFIALTIHRVKNYYGCTFCKGWTILLPSVRLVAKEAEAMMKIIKSCASGHKAIKYRWIGGNFAFLSDPFHLLLAPPTITTRIWCYPRREKTKQPGLSPLASWAVGAVAKWGLISTARWWACARQQLYSFGSPPPSADYVRTPSSIIYYN